MGNYTAITYVYGLFNLLEPDVIRYIGKSNNPEKRLKEHISESKSSITYKSNWIRSFDAKKYLKLKILKICPIDEYVEFEEKYIRLYKSNNLTNSDETGLGNIGRKREIINSITTKISKNVYQFDLNGNYLNDFKSTREASRQLLINHSQIIRCCNGQSKHANGYIFKYDKNSIIEQIKNPNSVRKQIIEIDGDGTIINKWKSLMDCSRQTKIDNGNLSKVCNGKSPSIKGRKFKFV